MPLVLSARGSTQIDMACVEKSTARTLGSGSSDDVMLGNAQDGPTGMSGGRNVGYDATAGKGRRFGCTVFIVPGMTPIAYPIGRDRECLSAD
ncbi:hypothetical protein [Burkholderia paludis]|uniref:hypothetical protein n=1 Tax=Burkholderia paludis TaxID=1506587 RepID=UPI00068AD91D|nr:hypothetical protein [Burkholderia paludis]